MSKINWLHLLGWNHEQLEDLRHAGFAYIRQGKYEIALPIFRALVILEPDNAYDAQTLGAILLELDQADVALKYLQSALKVEADHSPTLLNLAKALLLTGKKDEGLKLAKILTNDPNRIVSNTAKALLLAYG